MKKKLPCLWLRVVYLVLIQSCLFWWKLVFVSFSATSVETNKVKMVLQFHWHVVYNIFVPGDSTTRSIMKSMSHRGVTDMNRAGGSKWNRYVLLYFQSYQSVKCELKCENISVKTTTWCSFLATYVDVRRYCWKQYVELFICNIKLYFIVWLFKNVKTLSACNF